MSSGSRIGSWRRPSAAARAALLALPLLAACAPPHDAILKQFSAPDPTPAAGPGQGAAGLEALVQFSAGHVRVGRAPDGLLYDARIVFCRLHTEPVVEYVPPAGRVRGRLDISLRANRTGFYGFGGEGNEAIVGLPSRGLDSLHVETGEGETVIDLSALEVPRVRINAGSGDAHVVFPADGALAEEILISGSVGDVTVDRLAGVSPREAILRGGVGTLEVDLAGRWRRDAHVSILGSVGNVRLALPRGVAIAADIGPTWQEAARAAGLRSQGDAFVSPDPPIAGPRLSLTLEPGLGKLLLEWEKMP